MRRLDFLAAVALAALFTLVWTLPRAGGTCITIIATEIETMPRPRVGSVFPHGDHYDIQITYPGGARSNRICQPADMSEAKARDRAAYLSELAGKAPASAVQVKGKPGAVPAGETFEAWSERWCAAREARGLASVETDRGRLRKWVLPRLGAIPIVDITTDDVRGLVEFLDEQVLAGELAGKTAVNAWGLVTKAFADAKNSKIKALRVRPDKPNPAIDVEGPTPGDERSKTYLYGAELLQLVSSPDVPLAWKRSIALSVYLYTRPGELRALRWEDVDLEHSTVAIDRSVDREGKTKTTKTKLTRTVPIEPSLLPLLAAMRAEADGRGAVLELPEDRHLARGLRDQVRRAKLDRPRLLADDATRKNLTFYDLRATGITWRAVRGDLPLQIMADAGHVQFSTTQGYIRTATVVRRDFGEVFPPLPDELTGRGVSLSNRSESTETLTNKMEAPGIEPRLEGANPIVSAAFAPTTPLETYATGEAKPPEVGSRSDSERNPASVNARQIGALTDALLEAVEQGDSTAARRAWVELGAQLDRMPGGRP